MRVDQPPGLGNQWRKLWFSYHPSVEPVVVGPQATLLAPLEQRLRSSSVMVPVYDTTAHAQFAFESYNESPLPTGTFVANVYRVTDENGTTLNPSTAAAGVITPTAGTITAVDNSGFTLSTHAFAIQETGTAVTTNTNYFTFNAAGWYRVNIDLLWP